MVYILYNKVVIHLQVQYLLFYIFLGVVSISRYFPAIEESHAEKIAIYREDITVKIDDLVKGLCPDLQFDVYHIGFPSLHLIPITVR